VLLDIVHLIFPMLAIALSILIVFIVFSSRNSDFDITLQKMDGVSYNAPPTNVAHFPIGFQSIFCLICKVWQIPEFIFISYK